MSANVLAEAMAELSELPAEEAVKLLHSMLATLRAKLSMAEQVALGIAADRITLAARFMGKIDLDPDESQLRDDMRTALRAADILIGEAEIQAEAAPQSPMRKALSIALTALEEVDKIACRNGDTRGIGEEPPDPANRDGQELASVARAAIAQIQSVL